MSCTIRRSIATTDRAFEREAECSSHRRCFQNMIASQISHEDGALYILAFDRTPYLSVFMSSFHNVGRHFATLACAQRLFLA